MILRILMPQIFITMILIGYFSISTIIITLVIALAVSITLEFI